jgi:hypothetical protein
MDVEKDCYFCGNVCPRSWFSEENEYYYDCHLCGKYTINTFAVNFNKHKTACYLYYNNMENKELDNQRFIRLRPSQQTDVIKDEITITEVDVENWYPKTFQETVNIILIAVAKMSKGFGAKIFLSEKEFAQLFFIESDKTKTANLYFGHGFYKRYFEESELLNIDYIKRHIYREMLKISEMIPEDANREIQILPKGYERIYELQKNNITNKKVFIACQFTETGISNPILDAIKTAVHECGYIPNAICDKPHNNWIMSEILYEIKDSKFMIADLTGYRAGVYYEAGYGEALGKQVILTCKAGSEFEKVHFDLKQKFIIDWKDESDLTDRLKAQIKGTVGIV